MKEWFSLILSLGLFGIDQTGTAMIAKIFLSVVFNLLWVGMLFGLIIIPSRPDSLDNSTIDALLGSILCEPDERLQRVQAPNPLLDLIDIEMVPYCVNSRTETRRDVTERWTIIGIGGTALAFVISTIVEIWVALSLMRRKLAQEAAMGIVRGRNGKPIPKETVTDKLKQIETAYKAGLITYDEYDKARQDVFRNS